MHLHIIACRILYRELSMAAALSPHYTTVRWMEQGLHEKPEEMPAALQKAIDETEADLAAGKFREKPDAIVLGYGLCSNGTAGLRARSIPLVIPRTDDCIALFLGSQKRYLELFGQYPGTYWVNGAWIEEAKLPSPERYREMREQFVEQYGEENADFLMESGIGWGWTKNYRYCGYIQPVGKELPEWRKFAEDFAGAYSWELFETAGSNSMLEKLLAGEWDPAEFLVCPPGFRTAASGNSDKLIAVAEE
ncbi:MAG: DUF1638 domain-containing protein [Candidatus Merdivicinus sp.]|jgi:hypothetical protein